MEMKGDGGEGGGGGFSSRILCGGVQGQELLTNPLFHRQGVETKKDVCVRMTMREKRSLQ